MKINRDRDFATFSFFQILGRFCQFVFQDIEQPLKNIISAQASRRYGKDSLEARHSKLG
jgi:hypothetical protein